MSVFIIALLFAFNACLFPQSYDMYKAKSYNNFNNKSYNRYKNPAPYDALRESYIDYEKKLLYRRSRNNYYNSFNNSSIYNSNDWHYPYAIKMKTYDAIINSELNSAYPNFPKVNMYLNRKIKMHHLMNK